VSLVLLANRAPLRPTPDGGWAPALGGLATALLPVLDAHGGAWIAMSEPGDENLPRHAGAPPVQDVPGDAAGFTLYRVPLSADEVEAYYQGMANRVLWPVSHYLVHHVEPERSFRDAYRAVNDRFVAAALEAAPPGARFWVHDYHLMLAPEGLRAARPDARIGFFWHVPWPAPEVFRIVPSARALLRGVLGADRIGFHTEGYAENFREAARDLVGARLDGTAVEWQGRRIETAAHPIGIDVESFEAMADDPQTIREAHALRADLGGMHHGDVQLVLGIDRLDYTKGLLLRLEAFERFLELYPELHDRVILYQVATPSRTGVPAYDRLKRDVDEAVGRINGRFSRGAWVPVIYRYRSFAPDELAVLYRAADVGLVTPLRDGMNLVAHEFAAVSGGSRGTDQPGALVLSELTGASDYLDGAIRVNPYDTDALALALHQALHLTLDERRERIAPLKATVRRLNVHDWAAGFLDALGTAPEAAPAVVADDAPEEAEPVGADA